MPAVTLVLAALAALLNLWLTLRVGQVRRRERVSVGDGGAEPVIRRMRAHANFAENAPVIVLLVLAIELAHGPSPWLWAATALFVLARTAHALGMDGWSPGRTAGTGVTMALQVALAAWALSIVWAGHTVSTTVEPMAMAMRG